MVLQINLCCVFKIRIWSPVVFCLLCMCCFLGLCLMLSEACGTPGLREALRHSWCLLQMLLRAHTISWFTAEFKCLLYLFLFAHQVRVPKLQKDPLGYTGKGLSQPLWIFMDNTQTFVFLALKQTHYQHITWVALKPACFLEAASFAAIQ